MKKLNLLLLAVLIFIFPVKSQIGIIEDLLNIPIGSTETFLLNRTIDDATVLIEGYMNPLGTALGSGLNAGWYNTGKPHNFPGFDITFGGHTIMLPSASRTFSADFGYIYGNDLPTINGSSSGGQLVINPYENFGDEIDPQLGFIYDSVDPFANPEITMLETPGGGDWNNFFMPYIQASIGLVYDTELLFRYMPPISYSKMSANYWGMGIKHDFKQHIPVVKDLPFDASFLAAYSSLKSNANIYDDASIDFDVQAFNCNMILSKKIAILTAYAGVGYQHSTANLVFDGKWSYLNNNAQTVIQDNPINLSMGGVNGFKGTMGARIKLFLFTIHADYTLAEYNILTIGLGLNSDIGSKIIGGAIGK